MKEAGSAGDAIVAPLKRLVDKAESLEDLRDSIIDLYGEMDAADLGAVVARGMMMAEMSGRYEAKGAE